MNTIILPAIVYGDFWDFKKKTVKNRNKQTINPDFNKKGIF